MKYVSTRNKTLDFTSAQAIMKGLSEDGGLFCPAEIPQITKDELLQLCKLNYIERTVFVFKKFLTDFTSEELEQFAKNAYLNTFETQEVAPIVKTKENEYILELFRGPTSAFKDMALQMLPQLLVGSMKKLGEHKTACILVATSGDTGKAALEGFKDVEQTKILVFYPEKGVSDIQKLQMVTQKGENVSVCAINGNFDDAQTAVKSIFNDKALAEEFQKHDLFLSSANSINWGRLLPQVVYYVSAYCDMINQGHIAIGDRVNVCVPTGNFGNILAGFIAKNMGISIDKLICASNNNHVLADFFENDGIYDKNRPFHLTNSPSMDILVSSNLERLLFFISDYDQEFVCAMMDSLGKTGKYQVAPHIFNAIRTHFAGGYCNESDTQQMIKTYFEKTGYLLDTHTAVAVKVYEDYKKKTGDKTPVIITSTASPYKFADSVLEALGNHKTYEGTESLEALFEKTKMPIPAGLWGLKQECVRFEKIIDKTEISREVINLL